MKLSLFGRFTLGWSAKLNRHWLVIVNAALSGDAGAKANTMAPRRAHGLCPLLTRARGCAGSAPDTAESGYGGFIRCSLASARE